MSEERTFSYPFIRHEYDSQGIHPKTCPLANSKMKNNHIIVRWRSSIKDLLRLSKQLPQMKIKLPQSEASKISKVTK